MAIRGTILLVVVLLAIPFRSVAQPTPEVPLSPSPGSGKPSASTGEAERLEETAAKALRSGRMEEAEALLRTALSVRERTQGPEHLDTARCLARLGIVVLERGDDPQADALLRRALAIREKVLGPGHPDTANAVQSLAVVALKREKFEEFAELQHRALKIRVQTLGPEHPDVADSLGQVGLGVILISLRVRSWPRPGDLLNRIRGEQTEPVTDKGLRLAEYFLGQALEIYNKSGKGHEFGHTLALNNLAYVYVARGRRDEAEALLKRSVAIAQATSSLDPTLAAFLFEQYASALRRHHFDRNARAEARALTARARDIRANGRATTSDRSSL